MNETYSQEEAFFKLKKVCLEEGLDKYKNVSTDCLDTMIQILCIGHKNITAENAYDWSSFGYEVLWIISDDQNNHTMGIRAELLKHAKKSLLQYLTEGLGIIKLLDWISDKFRKKID